MHKWTRQSRELWNAGVEGHWPCPSPSPGGGGGGGGGGAVADILPTHAHTQHTQTLSIPAQYVTVSLASPAETVASIITSQHQQVRVRQNMHRHNTVSFNNIQSAENWIEKFLLFSETQLARVEFTFKKAVNSRQSGMQVIQKSHNQII